jgi:hypothetical protein
MKGRLNPLNPLPSRIHDVQNIYQMVTIVSEAQFAHLVGLGFVFPSQSDKDSESADVPEPSDLALES